MTGNPDRQHINILGDPSTGKSSFASYLKRKTRTFHFEIFNRHFTLMFVPMNKFKIEMKIQPKEGSYYLRLGKLSIVLGVRKLQ